jgi:pimeloyl-ACP methyl ester carboxylesterase
MLNNLKNICLYLVVLTQLGCGNMGDRRADIPVQLREATQASAQAPLVVVLPGRSDNIEVMSQYGIAEAIQRNWPAAQVLLTSATLAYYLDGALERRLHQEIILPARNRGVTEIWLVGASLGGMGALLYERAHPGEVQGIVLLAPYLGQPKLLKEIAQAGGINTWDPGIEPQPMSADTYQRELWRYLKSLSARPELAARIWIAYGDQDRLRKAIPVIAPLLPANHVLERQGAHKWSVWTPAAEEIFQRVAKDPPR